MLSLQLEEVNLNRRNCEQASSFDVAFNVNTQSKSSLSKIDILKKKTKCNTYGQVSHWARDKVCSNTDQKDDGKSNKDKDKSELAWFTIEYSDEKESSCWLRQVI